MSATFAACLTPPGAGAIAVLAVRGPRALEIVQELWSSNPKRAPRVSGGSELSSTSLPPLTREARLPHAGHFSLGRFGAEAADEAVLTVRRLEPTPWLEIHCHGGPAVVRMGLDLLAARGAVVCSWQELERQTSGRPLQAAAAAALAEAHTARTAGILLDQYHGALEESLRGVLSVLDQNEHDQALALLDELAERVPLGLHLTQPWRVVIAGAPNVGKSSLVNALAGYQRSVVAAVPGTTRDVLTATIAVDGWPVELTDTAGLRAPTTDLEGQGIERARAAIARADLCLWVLDSSAAPVWAAEDAAPPGNVRRGFEDSAPATHFVLNKADLPAAWDLAEAADAVRLSAQTGVGIPELCARLAQWLAPAPPPSGSAVPFTAALASTILEARRLLQVNDTPAATALLRDLL